MLKKHHRLLCFCRKQSVVGFGAQSPPGLGRLGVGTAGSGREMPLVPSRRWPWTVCACFPGQVGEFRGCHASLEGVAVPAVPLGLSSLPFCFLPRPHTPPFSTLSLLQISISLPSTSHLEASALVVIFYSRRQLTSTPRIVFCFKKEIMHLLCAPGTVHLYTRGVCVCVCVCPQILLKGP